MKLKQKKCFRKVRHQCWDTSDYETIKMYGIVYVDNDGFKIPFGNNFKHQKQDLDNAIDDILQNNDSDRLVRMFGKNILHTLEVAELECYPNGHFIQICNYPYWDVFDEWVASMEKQYAT